MIAYFRIVYFLYICISLALCLSISPPPQSFVMQGADVPRMLFRIVCFELIIECIFSNVSSNASSILCLRTAPRASYRCTHEWLFQPPRDSEAQVWGKSRMSNCAGRSKTIVDCDYLLLVHHRLDLRYLRDLRFVQHSYFYQLDCFFINV